MSSDPLIVSALLGTEDFAWLDALRRTHYPVSRNRLPAHLTLFRHLPPSLESELRQRLREATRGPPPHAQAAGLLDLGSGVAVRIVSPGLEAIRAALAEAFEGLLVPQDAAGWRPHVTIQNKVAPAEARALRICLTAGFQRRDISLDGLAVFAYREGLWKPASRHMFRG